MSHPVQKHTELPGKDGEFSFMNGTPEVLIFDDSPLASGLVDELEQINWECSVVSSEGDAFDRVGGDVDCLVFDPDMLAAPMEFLFELRQNSEIPVIVWGDDTPSEILRQIASVPDADYVPKATDDDEKIFCVPSLNELPYGTPMNGSSGPSRSSERDQIFVSIIYYAVRAYWMSDRIETQLDAIENSLNGIAILNDDSEFIYMNEAFVELFGYDSPDILLGNSAQMCFPHHEIDRFREDVLPEARAAGDWRGGIDCRQMTGNVFPARVSVSWLDDGEYVLTVEDVSEQQILQEELEEIHQHIGQAFIAVDDDLRISYLNRTARAYFGLSDQEDVVGEDLFDVQFRDLEEELRDGLAEVDTNDEQTVFSLYLDSRDSWLETRIYPFERGYAMYFRDITEEKERQKELDLARAFIRETEDAYYIIELETNKIVDVNPSGHQWLGTGEDDLIGMSVLDLVNTFSNYDNYTEEDHAELCEAARGEGYAIHEGKYGPPAGEKYPVKARCTCEEINGTEYLIVASSNVADSPSPEQRGPNVGATEAFVEACPDPVVLMDSTTHEIIEVNSRVTEVTGFSRDDLVGSHYRRLFPDEIADEQVDKHQEVLNEGGGRYRRLNDGSYVKLQSDSGATPVEISTTTVETGTETAHLNVIRTIREPVEYERSFQLVNEMTHDLVRRESPNKIAKSATDAIQDMPVFIDAAVYLYDDDVAVLRRKAHTGLKSTPSDGAEKFEPGDGGLWDVYKDRETRIFNSGAQLAPTADSQAEVAVPIGSHGVLFLYCSSTVTDGGVVENFATVVGSSIESALDRAESVTELKQRQREAKIQKQQLEYVSDLNTRIRSLNSVLVQAESKDGIKEAVCEELVSLDQFEGILLTDTDGDGLNPQSTESAEIPDEFLEDYPLADPAGSPPPTTQAAQEQAAVDVPKIASRAQQESWANIALEHEYKSVVSIPLEYGDISYGVLTIYSDLTEAFDGRTKEVLKELGSLIAYAFHAVTSRAALGSNNGIDLTFTITDTGGLSDLAGSLNSTLTVQNVTPANDDDYYLVHTHIPEADHTDVLSAVDASPTIEDTRVIGEPESGIYELRLNDAGSLINIVDLGVSLQAAIVNPDSIQATVTLPANRNRTQFIGQVKNQIPATAELSASQENIDTDTIPWTRMLRSALTPKQETALRTAYYVGYFDSPSKTNGRELAERLGVTQGTISYRLRAAQRNLYETLWDNSQEQVVTSERVGD